MKSGKKTIRLLLAGFLLLASLAGVIPSSGCSTPVAGTMIGEQPARSEIPAVYPPLDSGPGFPDGSTLTPTDLAATDPAKVPPGLPTAAPTFSPAPLPTPSPTIAPSPTPSLSPKPTPKATPKPTPKPTPACVVINGITYYRGYADPRTIKPQPVPDPTSLTAVVNKYHALTADYLPALVSAEGTSWQIHPEANAAWIQMSTACELAIGVQMQLLSAYRSYAAQAKSYTNALERKGVALTVPYNAYQGRSEHQLGLAIDVNDGVCTPLKVKFAQTATYAWLRDHAHEYGFILRYQAGKEKITGYAYEPWHYRYVGIEVAEVCRDKGWVLEEYAGLEK